MRTWFNRRMTTLACVALSGALCLGMLPACSAGGNTSETQAAIDAARPVSVRVATLKGAGAISMASFANEAAQGSFHNNFQLVSVSSTGAITTALQEGTADIVVVPPDVAVRLNRENPGTVKVASVVSTGGLYLVSSHKDTHQFEDLAGKTVYLTGGGTTTEYVVRCLLEAKGIADQVTLEFMSDPSEVVAALSAYRTALGILPEPYATAAHFKDERLWSALDLSTVWAEVQGEDAQIVSSVALVSASFAQNNPEAMEEFFAAQQASVDAYRSDPDALSELVVAAGLVDSVEVAEAVLPTSGMACITGNKMRTVLSDYLWKLYEAHPEWIGEPFPSSDFYYVAS